MSRTWSAQAWLDIRPIDAFEKLIQLCAASGCHIDWTQPAISAMGEPMVIRAEDVSHVLEQKAELSLTLRLPDDNGCYLIVAPKQHGTIVGFEFFPPFWEIGLLRILGHICVQCGKHVASGAMSSPSRTVGDEEVSNWLRGLNHPDTDEVSAWVSTADDTLFGNDVFDFYDDLGDGWLLGRRKSGR